MFKKIALVLVLVIAGLLVYAATTPDSFHVERTASINADPEKIFLLINDFHSWSVWSPWEKLDSEMKRIHSGAASGKGAVYEWEGNSQVGKGRMEILDATFPSRVTVKLDFLEPFEGHNIAEFTLSQPGDSTNVTWSMDGPSPYMAKLMGVFVDMDAMIGKDFQTGLSNLRVVAEGKQ